MLSVLLIVDSLAKLNVKLDTSLALAQSLLDRGHRVRFAHLQSLALEGTVPSFACFSLDFSEMAPEGPSEAMDCSEFDAIVIRKEPPVDLDYLAMTWALDHVHQRTQVINHPDAIRRLNEKLANLVAPEFAIPQLLTSDPRQIVAYAKKFCPAGCVIKPLDLFGGRGVSLIENPTLDNLTAALDQSQLHGNFVVVQPFKKEIYDGEVRVFVAFGQIISWCLKKPTGGSFVANTSFEAALEPFTPDVQLEKKAKSIAEELLRRKVTLAAIDFIGGQVSEINITSPRLLAPNEEQKAAAYGRLVDAIERNVRPAN